MRLLVMIPDDISAILAKGEYQPLYYNPGELADEVHILTTAPCRPDMAALQRTAGRADLFLHIFPADYSLPSKHFPFLTPWRLRRWAKPGIALARTIQPDLIRCHGADWNVYLAAQIKAEMGVPYCVSLHINPDVNPNRRYLSPTSSKERRHNAFYEYLEGTGLRAADQALPVYKPVLPYLARLGVQEENTQVCYNVLNTLHLEQKNDYSAHMPFRLICVGRLFDLKNPENIIRALVRIPDAALTIVGDGSARPELEALTTDLGLAGRIRFVPAIHNDELCRLLPEQDAFVVHTEHLELNKSVLEALLTGLPVIINRRMGDPVPEFEEGDFVRLVDNTPESYQTAITELIDSQSTRESLGRCAYAHARARWDPAITEAAYVAVYKELLEKRHAVPTMKLPLSWLKLDKG
jgi:glycosyltransferase involved in cell wall biosynthesis